MIHDDIANQFEECRCDVSTPSADKGEVSYRLLKPKRLNSGRGYPLVLFLHGAGERGADNRLQLAHFPEWMAQDAQRETYPCYVVAPQCPTDQQWVNVPWGEVESRDAGPVSDSLRNAMAILETVQTEHPIDHRRVYLTGLSMGGYGAWDFAIRQPDLFAAIVPICGGGDESKAKRLIDSRIWAVHGDRDDAVPVERSRRMIAAIRRAGGQPKYTELVGVGHHSWNPAYRNPNGPLPWMFQQVAPIPRFAPEQALPEYSYVSGLFPHPTRDSKGHSFGKREEPVAAPDPQQWERSPRYLYGVDLFNHGYYWEAHEAWESLWHACGRRGPAAAFFKGLIKLAAAGVKRREGRASGVATHAHRADELFRQTATQLGSPERFLGLRLDSLSRLCRQVAELPPTAAIGDADTPVKVVFPFLLRPADELE